MPAAVAVPIAGAVIGGFFSSQASASASESAAGAQAAGTAAQIAELRRQFDLNRQDLGPAREAQAFALERLIGLINDPSTITDAPGFEFRREQGRATLEESAAARGDLFSGGTLRALEEFGQNFATSELNQEFNRLSNLAGLGAGGVNQGVASGTALAGQIGQAFQTGGAQQAGGFLREGQIQANLINSIANNAIFAGRLNQITPGPTAAQFNAPAPGLVGAPTPTPLQLSGPF